MIVNVTLRIALCTVSVFVVAGCATDRSPASESVDVIPVGDGAPHIVVSKPSDLQDLRGPLGLSTQELGFFEKPINSCSLPREYRTNSNCESKYFTLINFQVMCRDSVGTVESVSEDAMTPMISRNITWLLGKIRGKTYTDQNGYGNIVALTSVSSKERTFILKVKNLALGLSAGEVRRIVVPKNWCR
jgi:hypothetical protein